MTRQLSRVAKSLEALENAADSLWESLPSADAAQKHLGDFRLDLRPPTLDIVREATQVLLAAEFGKPAEELVEWFYCDTDGLENPPTEQEKLDFVCDWFHKRFGTPLRALVKEDN